MATFLLHHVSSLCVQIHEVSVLAGHLRGDSHERYVADPTADPKLRLLTGHQVLDHALELALLGGSAREHAEGKAAALLKDVEGSADLLRLLKELAERNYTVVVRDATQLALQEQEEVDREIRNKRKEMRERMQRGEDPFPPRDEKQELAVLQKRGHPLTAMSLLRCAMTRAWDTAAAAAAGTSVVETEPVGELLLKHSLRRTVNRYLDTQRNQLLDYGFVLRAPPTARVQLLEEKDDDDEAPSQGGTAPAPLPPPPAAEAAAAAAAAAEAAAAEAAAEAAGPPLPEEDPMVIIGRDPDGLALAHLELMQVAPLLKEMQQLPFYWHDLSRFQYFDLQQIQAIAKKLSEFSKDLSSTDLDMTTSDFPEFEEKTEETDMEEWKIKEASDKKSRRQAFELLRRAMKPLAHSAIYAAGRRADGLLFTSLIAGLNALLIAAPSPEECVPPGPHANPKDTDPDMHVGLADGEMPPGEEKTTDGAFEAAAVDGGDASSAAAPLENDIWQNVAVIARLAVEAVQRLKGEFSETEAPREAAAMRMKKDANKPSVVAESSGGVGGGFDSTIVPRQSKRTRSKAEKEDTDVGEEEAQVIRVATEAAKEMEAADEELRDLWFEQIPHLDITSVAKFVAFAALCMYKMQRWNNVMSLCRSFNDATCSVFATTFLPLAIGAQREVCKLSQSAMGNTERYQAESKRQYEADQKAIPKPLLRQLAMQGLDSEPKKLFNVRSALYTKLLKRQKRLDGAWQLFLKTLEDTHALACRAVPAAMDALRKSRMFLAEFLQDRQAFNLGVRRSLVSDVQKVARERGLRIAAMALVSSYRKSVELLRKKQMASEVVQGLHELGNLLWLEGDVKGAAGAWSDAVDAAFQHVYSIKSWRKCVETSVRPPKDAARAELMMLAVIVVSKHARLITPGHAASHFNAALFASAIIEAVLHSALPHPSQRMKFAPEKYRMREIFFGLRESRLLLSPNSVYGGVDGRSFLDALIFFHQAIHAAGCQLERCLPLCSLHVYVATDVCRSRVLAITGRLMMTRSLIACRSFASAWTACYSIVRRHDMPRALLVNEVLDALVVDAKDAASASPFLLHEEPFTDHNKDAVAKLIDFSIVPDGDSQAIEDVGRQNVRIFTLAQAEFLVAICSYGRVFTKVSDPEEECRRGWLEKAEGKLVELWKEVTGNDDDIEAWSIALTSGRQSPPGPNELAEAAPAIPTSALSAEEGVLCIDIRLLRAQIWELRGDLGKGVREILYGMRFFQLLAAKETRSGTDCGVGAAGADSRLRTHADVKTWMQLRRRLIQLLLSQGRVAAASEHIEHGLRECARAHDDVALVELLAAQMRLQILEGRLLEVHGDQRIGAVPTGERCLAVARKHLSDPTPSVVLLRMTLALLLEQNPSLGEMDVGINVGGAGLNALGGAASEEPPPPIDPYDHMLLEAAGRVVVSPIARELQARPSNKQEESLPVADKFTTCQQAVIEMVTQSIADLDFLLKLQDFRLHPTDHNALFCFEGSDDAHIASSSHLLPPLVPTFRERPVSDARAQPNVYSELMPLRLHCELVLARLRLEMGELDDAFELLQNAETRLTRCVFLLPWLYVEFCVLKLRLRRLTIETGQPRVSPSLEAPKHEQYRDHLFFRDGICPSTDSPLFRTFIKRAVLPSLTVDSEWYPRPLADGDNGVDEFLKDIFELAQKAVREGGHDYAELFALFREGVEEVLRCPAGPSKAMAIPEGEDSQVVIAKLKDSRVHALLSLMVAVVECRKALQFEPAVAPPPEEPVKGKDTKGAIGPVPFDAATLPPRVTFDLKHHLARQAWEGALAYSQAAQQDVQKAIPFKTLVRHASALRRECELFGNLYHSERLLADQLHMVMSASESYAKAKVLSEAQLASLQSPPETPTTGDILIAWMQPSRHATLVPPKDYVAFVAFICPLPPVLEGPPAPETLVRRCNTVRKASLRNLQDGLCTDLDHCKPASHVASEYLARRLRAVARVLLGGREELPEPEDVGGVVGIAKDVLEDPVAEAGLQKLLISFGSETVDGTAADGDDFPEEKKPPEVITAEPVRGILRALIRVLDGPGQAARIAHPALGLFLRDVLAPL
eukprot:TRINITY_DN40521_c0_g4_i1.p1 TRINITY_DN40521_c0_g4~~TRINITY_DN40521_c0_g4_i1.p1  ORF type:complete len:2318 (+),score=451.91 TRINITY_DN40521_c0_g4_i1:703-6954(+)